MAIHVRKRSSGKRHAKGLQPCFDEVQDVLQAPAPLPLPIDERFINQLPEERCKVKVWLQNHMCSTHFDSWRDRTLWSSTTLALTSQVIHIMR